MNEQKALELLSAANANPLPREEVIARLKVAIRRNLTFTHRRDRRGGQSVYDEVVMQELEAIASAIHYLQQNETSQ